MTVIGVTETAQQLGCDPSTVRRWIRRLGVGRKVGSCWWIDHTELAAIRRHVRETAGNPSGWQAANRAKRNRKVRPSNDLR